MQLLNEEPIRELILYERWVAVIYYNMMFTYQIKTLLNSFQKGYPTNVKLNLLIQSYANYVYIQNLMNTCFMHLYITIVPIIFYCTVPVAGYFIPLNIIRL